MPGPKERPSLAAMPRQSQPLIPIVLWLLRDEWLLPRPQLAQATWALLQSDSLTRLAKLVRADAIINDPDRREELVRLCLKELGLIPDGESDAQAADRLATLDSVERERVIRRTRRRKACP